jgi:hypothetical protein
MVKQLLNGPALVASYLAETILLLFSSHPWILAKQRLQARQLSHKLTLELVLEVEYTRAFGDAIEQVELLAESYTHFHFELSQRVMAQGIKASLLRLQRQAELACPPEPDPIPRKDVA